MKTQNQITKFNMLNNSTFINSRKNDAQKMLASFKFTEAQKKVLSEIAKKGYVVANINEIRLLFGYESCSFVSEKSIISIHFIGLKNRKKDIIPFSL
jgi:hypothetical protein